jgi:hypothetical protein
VFWSHNKPCNAIAFLLPPQREGIPTPTAPTLHLPPEQNRSGRPVSDRPPPPHLPARNAQVAVPVQTGCVLVVALTTSVQVCPASCGCVAVTVICVGVAPLIVITTPGLPTKFIVVADSVPLAWTWLGYV